MIAVQFLLLSSGWFSSWRLLYLREVSSMDGSWLWRSAPTQCMDSQAPRYDDGWREGFFHCSLICRWGSCPAWKSHSRRRHLAGWWLKRLKTRWERFSLDFYLGTPFNIITKSHKLLVRQVEANYTVANGYQHDAKVIYGDTDSVMVRYWSDLVGFHKLIILNWCSL